MLIEKEICELWHTDSQKTVPYSLSGFGSIPCISVTIVKHRRTTTPLVRQSPVLRPHFGALNELKVDSFPNMATSLIYPTTPLLRPNVDGPAMVVSTGFQCKYCRF